MNVNTLKFTGSGYPENLKQIIDPPQQLYWAGTPFQAWIGLPKVAIVGSRKFSAYGKSVAAKLAYELAQFGVEVLSGLAFGIDITAYRRRQLDYLLK